MAQATDKPVYDNDQYWNQRLQREFSLAGVGHTGVGLAFNGWAYRVRRSVLRRALREQGIKIAGARILELGFGTGYYLDLWKKLGAGHITGFDITDIAVQAARERFSGAAWRFEKADIGAPLPLGDSAGNIPPGTAFESLPDTWVCPVCGAPKDQFEAVK